MKFNIGVVAGLFIAAVVAGLIVAAVDEFILPQTSELLAKVA